MKTRKGFTLWELLIVIIIIGILMTFMTFSMTSSEAIARADNIIANLSSIGMAAQAFYLNSADKLGKMTRQEISDWFSSNSQYPIRHYIDGGLRTPDREKYDIVADATTGSWYARYNIGQDRKTGDIRYELMDRVIHEGELAGVLGYDGNSSNLSKAGKYNRQDSYVIMKIR